MRFIVIYVAILLLPKGYARDPVDFEVVLVLPKDDKMSFSEIGYRRGVEVLNAHSDFSSNFRVSFAKSIYVSKKASLTLWKDFCHLNVPSAVAILGTGSESGVSWIGDALHMPVFLTKPEYNYQKSQMKFTLRSTPGFEDWDKMIRDLVGYLGVETIALLYEDRKGLRKLQGILREPIPVGNVFVRKVEGTNFEQVLREVRSRKVYTILVDCGLKLLNDLLKASVTLRMTGSKYHYIVTNWDLETADLSGYLQARVNVTGFRLATVQLAKEKMQTIQKEEVGSVETEAAIAYDNIMILGKALSISLKGMHLQSFNLSCDNPWTDGPAFLKDILKVEHDGLTGPIKFTDKSEYRATVQFDIVRLSPEGLKSIGMWNTGTLNISAGGLGNFWDRGVKNDTLVVTCVVSTPYVMMNKSLRGNARFEGFSVDVLKDVAQQVGFKYVLEVVPDGKHGVYDPEIGEWNGIIRHLIDKNADLAIGALTINYEREKVIDFSKPFMNLGISILFKIPERRPSQLFGFLTPLSGEIWLYVVTSYILVSLTIFTVAKITPKERTGSDDVISSSQFSLSNAFWYPIGTLMQQGSDLNPRTISTRIVGGMWWFFSLIIVSSYTANLAAFLTCERMSTPIESADDLAEQSEISYGAVEAGSTMAFFKGSKIETYQKMWRAMSSRVPSVFVPSYQEGVTRVLEGNYAFLMESASLDYAVNQNCNLTQIGGLLDSKGFGIALPKGSPWRDKISLAILEMQERGVIQMHYNKWWKQEKGAQRQYLCPEEEGKHGQNHKANALGIDSIGGVFVVLFVGLLLSWLVSVFEFAWYWKGNGPVTLRIVPQLCGDMAEEAKFALRLGAPPQRPYIRSYCDKCKQRSTRGPLRVGCRDYHSQIHHQEIGDT